MAMSYFFDRHQLYPDYRGISSKQLEFPDGCDNISRKCDLTMVDIFAD